MAGIANTSHRTFSGVNSSGHPLGIGNEIVFDLGILGRVLCDTSKLITFQT